MRECEVEQVSEESGGDGGGAVEEDDQVFFALFLNWTGQYVCMWRVVWRDRPQQDGRKRTVLKPGRAIRTRTLSTSASKYASASCALAASSTWRTRA